MHAKGSKVVNNRKQIPPGYVVSGIIFRFLTPRIPSLPVQVHAGSVGASRYGPVHRIPVPAGEPSLVNPARADPEGSPRAQSDPGQPEHRRGV